MFACFLPSKVVIIFQTNCRWMFSFLKIVNENNTIRIPKKTTPWPCLWMKWSSASLNRLSLLSSWFDRFSSRVWNDTPIFHPWVRRKYSALYQWNFAKNSSETSSRHCFCSNVSRYDTYFAHSFLISKFSVNMRCTISFEMSVISANSQTFSRLSSSTVLWMFCTIFEVVTSFGRALQGSSLQIVRPRLSFGT